MILRNDHYRRLGAFCEIFETASWTERERMYLVIEDEPDSVDGDRWDRMLGAAAEYIAETFGIDTPGWAMRGSFNLSSNDWFLSNFENARSRAKRTSPGPFRRRGLYLEPRDLGRDGFDLLGNRVA